jgi:hypothetical protein
MIATNKGEKIMKAMTNAFSKRVWAVAVLAVLVVAGMATRTMSAHADDESNSLVGSWLVNVTVANPAGVPAFPSLMSFHADGTMQQSRPYFVPQFAALETAHYGAFKQIGANQFAVTDIASTQGAPGNTTLNGAVIGFDSVSFQPVVSADGNSFTAQWNSTATDTNGNVIVKASGTMSGVRIQIQP